MNKKEILVTGGAGYIGSHAVLQLLENGYEPIVVDNLSNSSQESLHRVATICGKAPTFYEADLRDHSALKTIFEQHTISGVMHFAGLKAVGESNEIPLEYYDQNIGGTVNLIKAMEQAGCFNFVFSSSATVYGNPITCPIKEDHPTSATNPYGRTKLFLEEILCDIANSNPEWNIIILRYFNPVGAHESGIIGEDPRGIPNNLVPYISQVATGKLEKLSVFGNDYPTLDGTGIRDYIHVVDLAEAHVKSIDKLELFNGVSKINLGTGKGYSVLQIVRTFEKVTGIQIPFEFTPKRQGDVAECRADASLAVKKLEWKARRNLHKMIEDSWRWQSQNPTGYS